MRAVSPVTQGRAPIFLNGRQLSRLSFLGFVWGCTARLRRTSGFLQPNSFLGSPSEFLENFCPSVFRYLCAVSPFPRRLLFCSWPSAPLPGRHFVPRSLDSSWFAFVRHDAHQPPLCPLYDGPYGVLKPGHEHFLLDFGGRQEVVSMDQLKPAHDLQDDPVVPAQAPHRGPPAAGLLDSAFFSEDLCVYLI